MKAKKVSMTMSTALACHFGERGRRGVRPWATSLLTRRRLLHGWL
ncbi:hypothetical protein ES288_D05G298000v1 [Gossypium darwinii]|uniref:Uncharacterized protein n=1 Tax=Gossypium darwinii TaxID=34276 RepID=A0A5D2CQD7_GOSDA|nr:hypothetical protein ES288_D05G298000v1 [Gossypium darwinii]